MELDYETSIDEDEVDEFGAFKAVLQGTSGLILSVSVCSGGLGQCVLGVWVSLFLESGSVCSGSLGQSVLGVWVNVF